MNEAPLSVAALALVLTTSVGAQAIVKLTPIQQRQALAARTRPAQQQNVSTVNPHLAPAPLVGGADSCTTPDLIVGTGNFAFDNTLATTVAQGQASALCAIEYSNPAVNNDVWFTWVAPLTGAARISTCSLTSVDTKIAIYAGNTCPAATALACDDDDLGACGGFFSFQSGVSFACTSGNSYVIQIGNSSFGGPTGTGQFSLSAGMTPTFDNCATPQALSGSGPFAFDNTNATTGSQGQAEALCNFYATTAIGNDLWYTWIAPSTGNFAVVTLGLTGVDTKISVYNGSGCPAAASIGCNEDGSVDFQSIAQFAATGGNTYTIQLGVNVAFVALPGTGQFQIIAQGPRANDDCSTPEAIFGTGDFPFDNTYSTTGAQGQLEPLCTTAAGPSVAGDSWYVWSPGLSGTATIDLCSGTFVDTKVSVYAGSGCPAGPAIACDDDGCGPTGYQSQVSFPIICGQSYTLQIGTYDYAAPAGGLGLMNISIAGAAPCATPYTVLCSGDGTDTPCPCANPGFPGRGCQNTFATGGASLSSTGSASVSADTLVLQAADTGPFQFGLYFEGNATFNPTAPFGVGFGNGLRCVGGTLINRLEIRQADLAGASTTTLSMSALGAAVSGTTYSYQLWYRDGVAPATVGTCVTSGFNFTNAIRLTWTP